MKSRDLKRATFLVSNNSSFGEEYHRGQGCDGMGVLISFTS